MTAQDRLEAAINAQAKERDRLAAKMAPITRRLSELDAELKPLEEEVRKEEDAEREKECRTLSAWSYTKGWPFSLTRYGENRAWLRIARMYDADGKLTWINGGYWAWTLEYKGENTRLSDVAKNRYDTEELHILRDEMIAKANAILLADNQILVDGILVCGPNGELR